MKNYLYQDLYNLEEKHWWHISKRKIVFDFIKQYNNFKKPKILDMGCGTGKNVESLKHLGTVYGIDSSLQAIKFCKQRGLSNISLEKVVNTNFPETSFNIITLLDVLEHTDDNKTLKEAHRILHKDGLIIITVPALPFLWSKWDNVLHHKRRYTKKGLEQILKKNHFHILKISYMYSFLILPVIITRTIKDLFFRKNYPSDFLISFSILNQILFTIARLEAVLVKRELVPLGLSVIVIAQK